MISNIYLPCTIILYPASSRTPYFALIFVIVSFFLLLYSLHLYVFICLGIYSKIKVLKSKNCEKILNRVGDSMPGHLSELHPVNEVNAKGQFCRASFGKNPRFQIQLDKRPLSPGTSRESSGVPCLNPRRGLTLLSPVCRDPAIGV